MAYISFDKLWRSEFFENVSAKDKEQDLNLNQLKLKVNDAFKIDEKLTTDFEPIVNEDVTRKTHLEKIIHNRGSLIISRKRLQGI